MAISDYADKDGKVNLIPEADYNTPEETPDVKAGNNNYNSKENNTRREQRRERRASNANPTRNNRNTELRRKTGKLGIKSSLDSFFGSGRDDQGLGQTPGIFQAQKAQLQADIDRENQRLDTVAAAEAELEAARVTQEGRHEVEAADAEFNRQQERLNELKAGRTSLERFKESGKTEADLRAEQARRFAFDDAVEAASAQRVSFDLHGRHLSRQMNDQQIQNAINELNRMDDAKLAVIRRNLAETAKLTGIAEATGNIEKLQAIWEARQEAADAGNNQLAAAFDNLIGAGLVGEAGSRFRTMLQNMFGGK